MEEKFEAESPIARQNSESQEKSNTSTTSEREFKRTNYWRCCGGVVDRRVLYIMVQIVVTLITLVYCMVMVFYVEDSTVWISMIATIAGNFLPNNIEHELRKL